eukprot:CAMPEP_0118881102 /NCGR_PEP_ID=MMETSP1163-20130328/20596_1 /TAXON_ID=124430 /ORGANISM="Phaeomonas parva, Strain CCMP2877" /LENGTH=101 /DNA_ID=CAMNT_0006817755 /DNA_START=184 /DNA_END=486 /DNA_ORIENTATION=+
MASPVPSSPQETLFLAVASNRADILNEVLGELERAQSGAAVATLNEQRAADGYTPLHLACEEGKIDCLRAILRAGGDPSVCDNAGRLPLDAAGGDGAGPCR